MNSKVKYLSDPEEFLEANYYKMQSWPKVQDFNVREFLRAGLTYNGDGHHDMLECVACGVVLGDWQSGDDPVQAHKTFYPECTYIQQVEKMDTKQRGPPEHEHMMTFQSRFESFKNWPSSLDVDVCTLADAGFFYSGVGDRVNCYYCDGQLKNWEDGDDPWMEHAHWYPACYYVHLVQGNDFINRARIDRRSPRVQVSEAFDQPIAQTLSENCIYCNINKKEHVFVPCGHIYSCGECSKYQIKCDCNATIMESVKLFNC